MPKHVKARAPQNEREERAVRKLARSHHAPCAGYLGYPFQNKQVKSCVENFAHDVDKEERIGVVLIISAFCMDYGLHDVPLHATS